MNHNLKITNSLTRKKELFKPINPEQITMYACGPTVYDNPHVGNARTLVVFDILFRTLEKFKGLNFRQRIIYNSNRLTVINDSKATSFSSSVSLLSSLSNVYWIVGGLAKKGDKLLLNKRNNKNIKAYIFGKDKIFFINKIKRLMKYESFFNLKDLIKKIFIDIKSDYKIKHKIILFSPAAASFDSFKNFEERGKYFNKIINKYINAKL